jgi:hypothetical protein
MEDVRDPGAGVDEPFGVGTWNGQTVVEGTGEGLLGPDPAEVGSLSVYNRVNPGKWAAAERESEGS